MDGWLFRLTAISGQRTKKRLNEINFQACVPTNVFHIFFYNSLIQNSIQEKWMENIFILRFSSFIGDRVKKITRRSIIITFRSITTASLRRNGPFLYFFIRRENRRENNSQSHNNNFLITRRGKKTKSSQPSRRH